MTPVHGSELWSGPEVPAGLREPTRSRTWIRSHLPTTILWPGFLADTLLYAGLVCGLQWGLVSGAGRLCPACGHSRAGLAPGSPCPECGAGLV